MAARISSSIKYSVWFKKRGTVSLRIVFVVAAVVRGEDRVPLSRFLSFLLSWMSRFGL